jgi:hypothetical protein
VLRYKFDRSREFIPGYKVGGEHWRSVAVQAISEPGICQGAGFKFRVDASFASRSFSEGWCPGATIITNLSRVQEQKLRIRRLAETKSRHGGTKSVTSNLPILSVLAAALFIKSHQD